LTTFYHSFNSIEFDWAQSRGFVLLSKARHDGCVIGFLSSKHAMRYFNDYLTTQEYSRCVFLF
ncbi:hypothetical protein OFP00_25995, partial [Escherichia coli]|nr:hypothetical protein [Escherichia coli]